MVGDSATAEHTTQLEHTAAEASPFDCTVDAVQAVVAVQIVVVAAMV